jgi:hypothetical protein
MKIVLGLFLTTCLTGFSSNAATDRAAEALNSLKALTHPAVVALIESANKIKLMPHEMIDGPEIQELLSKLSPAEYIKNHLLDSNTGDQYSREVFSDCKGPKHKQQCSVTILENYFTKETQEKAGENALIFEFELNAGKIKSNTVKVNLAG